MGFILAPIGTLSRKHRPVVFIARFYIRSK